MIAWHVDTSAAALVLKEKAVKNSRHESLIEGFICVGECVCSCALVCVHVRVQVCVACTWHVTLRLFLNFLIEGYHFWPHLA